MSEEKTTDALGELWRDQELSIPDISIEQLRRKHRKLARQVWWRNARELVAAVFVAAFFGRIAWQAGDWLTRWSAIELVVAAVWIVAVLHRHGRVEPEADAEVDTRTHLARHRAALERQRKLLAGAATWYVAPLAVGFVGLSLGGSIYGGLPWGVFGGMLAFEAGLCALVIALNRAGARALARAIDTLEVEP